MSADARRAQLIEVGWELLQSRPIHELPLDEVAAAAGISRTLLFHYFPTKADFYFAVVSTMGERLLRPPRLPEGLGAVERIRTLVDGFVRLVERNRMSYTALVRERAAATSASSTSSPTRVTPSCRGGWMPPVARTHRR